MINGFIPSLLILSGINTIRYNIHQLCWVASHSDIIYDRARRSPAFFYRVFYIRVFMKSGTYLGGGQIGFSTIFFRELQLTRSNGWALQ